MTRRNDLAALRAEVRNLRIVYADLYDMVAKALAPKDVTEDGTEGPEIVAPNPLSADIDWAEVERTLGLKIVQSPLQSEVIHSSGLGERQGDLLRTEADPVDRVGQFPQLFRLRALLQLRGLTGAGGDVRPGFVEGFSTAQHDDSCTSVTGLSEGRGAAGSVSADSAAPPLTVEDVERYQALYYDRQIAVATARAEALQHRINDLHAHLSRLGVKLDEAVRS
jgi:hypothetical protein